METYIVRVNGEEFEVEIERADGSAAPAAPAKAAAAPAPKKAPAKSGGGKGKGEPVVCGTAGKVFKIVAQEGQEVKSGDTVIVLEAMKMEIPVV